MRQQSMINPDSFHHPKGIVIPVTGKGSSLPNLPIINYITIGEYNFTPEENQAEISSNTFPANFVKSFTIYSAPLHKFSRSELQRIPHRPPFSLACKGLFYSPTNDTQ